MLQHPSIAHLVKAACVIALAFAPTYLHADPFAQINLVSNVPGLADITDPNLKNPWGVSFSPTSPFWVSNQGSGTSTLYDGAGNPASLVVAIPAGPTPPNGPTGQVFNGGPGFLVNGASAHFIFDTLNGTIAGWSGGTSAVVMASTAGAIYTGLAENTSAGSTYLYAANSKGNIHVFNSSWADVTSTTFAGKFADPSAQAAGFVPFNIQSIGSNLYVTYAQLTPMGTGLPGGYVDEFDASGNFIKRIATGGALFAPWGITFAPAGFGPFGNDLLIGNFGNGEILIYDPATDAFLGTLDGENGQPFVNSFLWALETRTGGANIDPNAVYFTAGIDGQQDGLFGKIIPTPEPATIIETAFGLLALAALKLRRLLHA